MSGFFRCKVISVPVFSVFAEKYGLPKETALKIGCGFGGGMRNAEVCGAVTGGIMVISLRYGHCTAENTDGRSLCYEKTKEYVKFLWHIIFSNQGNGIDNLYIQVIYECMFLVVFL